MVSGVCVCIKLSCYFSDNAGESDNPSESKPSQMDEVDEEEGLNEEGINNEVNPLVILLK